MTTIKVESIDSINNSGLEFPREFQYPLPKINECAISVGELPESSIKHIDTTRTAFRFD